MRNSYTIASILIVAGLTSAVAADQPPARALYDAALPANPHPKMVSRVEIAAGTAPGQAHLNWYRITCTKLSGDSFTFWLLADANPFNAKSAKTAKFSRYILQEPN